jgi:hypothetical protein
LWGVQNGLGHGRNSYGQITTSRGQVCQV